MTAALERERARIRAARPELSEDWVAEMAARNLQIYADAAHRAAAAARAEGARRTMKALARQARALGLAVRASGDREGRVSSYYVAGPRGVIRVSDHEIPWTEARDAVARAHGAFCYDGFGGPEIIVDRQRSTTWVRRALTLALAGRSVGQPQGSRP
jgi:hypothetical protein